MYYTLTYKNRPVIEESKLGILIENQLFESALGVPNDTCHFGCEIDASIIYADYYYIEALLKLKRLQEGDGILG